jgi:hypothetical protein
MYSIRLSEFAKLSEAAQASMLDAACRSVVSSDAEDLELVMDRIRGLEAKHGLSSDDMRRILAEGKLRETELICEWLILLDAAERLPAGLRRSLAQQSDERIGAQERGAPCHNSGLERISKRSAQQQRR